MALAFHLPDSLDLRLIRCDGTALPTVACQRGVARLRTLEQRHVRGSTMDNLTNSPTNSSPVNPHQNELWKYVQEMESNTVARLSQPASPEVLQLMEQNIQSLLGALPPSHFEVTITTDREQLGRLLASAMLNGYFLKTAEHRMELEKSFGVTNDQDLPNDLT